MNEKSWENLADWSTIDPEKQRKLIHLIEKAYDGKIDVITHFKEGVQVRQQRDTQGDGKFDSTMVFENGREKAQSRDTDGDGKIDVVVYFDKQNQPERDEIDTNADA